jgi:CheY-like chemotaxis protein
MKPCTLLVVDDDVDDHDLIRHVVSSIHAKCHMFFAINGLQALSLLADNKLKVDIILLDLNMPVMNGFEFLRVRKERAAIAQIPVIVHSTTIDPGIQKKLKELEVLDVLSKGNSIDDLKKNLIKVFHSCAFES